MKLPETARMVHVVGILLLASVVPAAFAAQPPHHSGLSIQGLKNAISHFWEGNKGLLCSDCVHLAAEVGNSLYKPPVAHSDDPNIASPGPGRRMKVPVHREEEILAALDAACGKLAARQQLGADVLQDCQRLVAEHRSALESSIFDKGTGGLPSFMCVDAFKLCDPHTLVDSGEL